MTVYADTSFLVATGVPHAATDLLYVAYAVELAADLFVTFDENQFVLATSTGMKAEIPPARSE